MAQGVEKQKGTEQQPRLNFQERLKIVFGVDERNIPKDPQELKRQLEIRSQTASVKEEVQESAKILLRELNRKEQLASLAAKNEKYKGSNIETMRARDLFALELAPDSKGFLSKTFAYVTKKTGEQIPFDPQNKEIDIKQGVEILIDFGSNADANQRVGAGDIIPAYVNVIRVIDTNGNVRIGRRCINGSRVGYYDENNRYIAIFNGYKIQIPTKEDIKKPETASIFGALKITDIFEENSEKIQTLEAQERVATQAYAGQLESMKQKDAVMEMISRISQDVPSTTSYKEKVNKMLERAKELKTKGDSSYSPEMLDLVIAQLERTRKSIEGLNVDFDWDAYKSSIAAHESGGNYYSRNDSEGRRRGVSSESWAFGKYQFITSTLRSYGVELGRPPEEDKIQAFLQDYELQERIMDRYMRDILEKNILPNSSIMAQVATGEKSIEFFLALTHIGGPGALRKQDGKDWLGTSVAGYAASVAANARNISTATPRIAQTKEKSPETPRSRFYLGDSIAVGLKLSDPAGKGFTKSGWSTDQVLTGLRKEDKARGDLQGAEVEIHCGTNDAANKNTNIENTLINIRQIAEYCLNNGATRVKIGKLAPIQDGTLTQDAGVRNGFASVQEYIAFVNRRIVDLNSRIDNLDSSEIDVLATDRFPRNSSDGIHYANYRTLQQEYIA